MTYEEVVSTIENRRRFGKACGRDVTRELLTRLDHPEAGMHVIHIAGTNGKGSTAAFLSSILGAAAFCVGTFTSPHLERFNERITVKGAEIPDEALARLGTQVLSVEMPAELSPTMFDYCLAVALLYFKECHCDYVVLETGLGGRLDSTAGLSPVPEVSVITNIGFDHMAILGNTLTEIAGNKAGIIRPGTKTVIAKMDPEAESRIIEECRQLAVEYRIADPEISKNYELGLIGPYQRENAANAIAAAEFLYENARAESNLSEEQMDLEECRSGKWPMTRKEFEQILARGLSTARWPGRMELIRREPLLLLDGAHNPQGIHALADGLRELWPEKKFHFVFGVMADKDYGSMIEELLPLAEKFYVAAVESDRALDGQALAELITAKGVPAEAFDSPKAALEAGHGDVVCCGSLYFIGELRSLLFPQN